MLGDEISETLWDRLSIHIRGNICRGCNQPYEREMLHVQPVDDTYVFVRCLNCSGEQTLPRTPVHLADERLRWLKFVSRKEGLADDLRLALLCVGSVADDQLVIPINRIAWGVLGLSPNDAAAHTRRWCETGLVEMMDETRLVLKVDAID